MLLILKYTIICLCLKKNLRIQKKIFELFNNMYKICKKLDVKEGDENWIEWVEMKNNICYYQIVVSVLSNQVLKSKISNMKILSVFNRFQEPIDNLTRFKIFKYKSIFYTDRNMHLEAIKNIKISAGYASKYIKYERENFLIKVNELNCYLNYYHDNLIKGISNIDEIRLIVDEFDNLKKTMKVNYERGKYYHALYAYKSILIYRKYSMDLKSYDYLFSACVNILRQTRCH